MRERIRQTYTSLEIGMMKEENELLKRRLERAIEYIHNNYPLCGGRELLLILNGEEETI